MDFKQLENYLASLPGQILDDASQIVAETATEYYKERFAEKAWDGNPWAPAKKERKNGSLLVDSGKLLGSIRPAYVGRDKVIISAGNDKVAYAKAHNEGFLGQLVIPAHTRQTKAGSLEVKTHTREANLPARPFMGKSEELADQIHTRLEGYINSLK